jgi:hypothetical protein
MFTPVQCDHGTLPLLSPTLPYLTLPNIDQLDRQGPEPNSTQNKHLHGRRLITDSQEKEYRKEYDDGMDRRHQDR